MFEKQLDDSGVLTLRLAHGKASAMDLDLLAGLIAEAEAIEKNDAIRSVLLTGTGNVFSAGVDLKQLLEGGSEYALKFVPLLDQTFEAFFALSKPVVAAINGHAIAGGCVLALACDYRVMAEGKGRIGIPELKVGVAFPVSAHEIVQFAVPHAQKQALIYLGDNYLSDEAKERGLVDEVVPADQLAIRAGQIAWHLASADPTTFKLNKRMLRDPSLDRMTATRERYNPEITAGWAEPQALENIRAFVARTMG